jgi:hypothetical protein
MTGRHDLQDMIDKMVEIIGASSGRYRNVWPPTAEELIEQVQHNAWTLRVNPA